MEKYRFADKARGQDMKETIDLLKRRGWHEFKCQECGRQYLAKKHHKNCASLKCLGKYEFLSFPRPRHFLTLPQIVLIVERTATKLGYRRAPPIGVVRSKERTLFASTAGQTFDKFIYSKAEPDPEQAAVVVFQPVIRLQHVHKVGVDPGVSTSFVHAGFEKWNAHPAEHSASIDAWLDIFSELGLYAGLLTLCLSDNKNDWDGLPVEALMLRFNLLGLELGVANFFSGRTRRGDLFTMSEVAVGVERLAWGVNRSPSYLDAVGPLPLVIAGQAKILDAIRTAVLMFGQGVQVDHRDHGSKARMILGEFEPDEVVFVASFLCRYYYRFWSSWTELSEPMEVVHRLLISELLRSYHTRICDRLRWHPKHGSESEDMLISNLRRGVIRIEDLYKAMRQISHDD